MMSIIIIKIIVSLYALLMILASVKELNSKSRWGNILNLISGFTILLSNFMNLGLFKTVAIIGLIIFELTAILNGLQNNSFHIKHHLTRFLITLIFIVLIIFI
ncbi:hypothetical protein GCM10025884_17750 [Leuconostoc gelidum subsp. gelidum]|jgi:carbon starvation protein CstA|nr:hypothetical protein C269_05250 [Leuconostoc gelidum JB7]GMA68148.1 hypothetical protein GCM10025884_17750 [Leuconostoc gelidum subsp. gelidum]